MDSTETLWRQHRIEQFVYREVRLLDERRWSEWEALFSKDGTYWAPASHSQPDPLEHVSLIYEDALLRKVRLARFDHPNAFSLQPFPHTAHSVSNVSIDSWDASAGEVDVHAVFQVHEFRREQPNIFAGHYQYSLVLEDQTILIEQKKATLVNCEGPLVSASVYF